ncbi:MAG: hypothetical protein GQ559_06380 [Desulfobulbaceae bacterium]|nr:hypothetical protein [Desulfobulbaceae bacterium]
MKAMPVGSTGKKGSMRIVVKRSGRFVGKNNKISAAKCFLVAACSWLLLLQGCAPMILAAGAGAGYLAADKQAARKVDKFLQDLGKSSSTSSRRISGTKQTEEENKYKQGAGPTVRLQDSSLKPPTVARGDSITSIITYGVMGGPSEGLTIEERRELWFNNKCLAVLQDESIFRENGTWKSRLVFKVPESASQGTYTVKQVISFKGTQQKSRKKFTVL